MKKNVNHISTDKSTSAKYLAFLKVNQTSCHVMHDLDKHTSAQK